MKETLIPLIMFLIAVFAVGLFSGMMLRLANCN